MWDGDTVHDWFVILLAVTADPEGEHPLATIYWGTAERYLGEERGRRPATGATRRRQPPTTAARALAARLSVPFRFADPDTPGGP